MHVSVASVLGDISSYVSSSSEGEGAPSSSATRAASDERESAGGGEGRQGADESGQESSDKEDEEDIPSKICLPVSVVLCKAGTTCFEAPLAGH